MKKQTTRTRRKKTSAKQNTSPARRKGGALTGLVSSRPNERLAECPTSDERTKAIIDPLTGDLPAVTLKDTSAVLFHFGCIDPRLAEAWSRDVIVHEGPITLRRVMSPVNFGGATHYAYVDRRLLWYLKHDPSNPVGARWDGYLASARDAPPGTIVVAVGRDIMAKRCPQQLGGNDQPQPLGEASSALIGKPSGAHERKIRR